MSEIIKGEGRASEQKGESNVCQQCSSNIGRHYFFCPQTGEGVALRDYILNPDKRKLLATHEELQQFGERYSKLVPGYAEFGSTKTIYPDILFIDKEGNAQRIALHDEGEFKEVKDWARTRMQEKFAGKKIDQKELENFALNQSQIGAENFVFNCVKQLMPEIRLTAGYSCPLTEIAVGKVKLPARKESLPDLGGPIEL